MKTRPKTFTAVVDFHCAGRVFAAGDVVDAGVLANVLAYGDQFVTAKRDSKSTPTPADEANTEGA